MRIGRRGFIGGMTGALVLPSLAGADEAHDMGFHFPPPETEAGSGTIVLDAAPASAQLAPADMGRTSVWAYGGTTPGPVLRVRQGGRLSALLDNRLPQASAIHWHGIRIDNRMDGVPGLTQAAVRPGERFRYDFVAPDAGTYWYHPHRQSWEQQARGLSGALIVEEPDAPAVDRDVPVLLQDWRLTETGAMDERFGSMHDVSHAGRLGNWTTVNGEGEATWRARRHERLRLRLINAATARIYTLALAGAEGWVVAVDGQPVSPAPLPERLVLAPAQRLDLIVDITAAEGTEAALAAIDRDGTYAVILMPVSGSARNARLEAPEELAPNPVTRPGSLAAALAARLVMEGGAMGGLASARLGDVELSVRELMQRGVAWAFNGVAGMPMEPLFHVERGRAMRITMVNDTAWPHAMHIHGHHFQTVRAGRAEGPLWDTYLMEPRSEVEIAFVADNPGRWMLHCHMAEHMAAGMMTWFVVA